MELNLILVLFTFGLASGFEFVIEPKSITALKGEDVLLSCSVTGVSDRGTIFWQRVNTGRYISMDYVVDPYDMFGDDMKDRYRIIGEPSVGEYSLYITNVKRSDIGRYACLYNEPSGLKTISRHATLSVLVPPGPQYPRCRVEPEGAVVGAAVDLICDSEGGLPPATLTWFRGNEILDGNYGKSGAMTENRYRKVLQATDRGVEFVCEASGIAIGNTLRTCSLTPLGLDISVQIKPQIKVANEGSRATFTCIAPGDMNNYDVYWSLGEEEIHLEDPRLSFRDGHPRLRIDPVKLSDHGKMVACIVYDFHGFRGNASSVLFVTKTEIEQPSKNTIVFEMEPASEIPTKISVVASVEGAANGVFTADLPAADQATAGNPNSGSVNPSVSPKAGKEMVTTKTDSPSPSPGAEKNNPSMIFTNHFAMPTVGDNAENATTPPPINRGDTPNQNIQPTEISTETNQTANPMMETTAYVTDELNANEVELPELQSDVHAEDDVEATEENVNEVNDDAPVVVDTPADNKNETNKVANNLEGTDTDTVADENEETAVSGQTIRIRIICSVLAVGVVLIGFGFWRFSKTR
ncbi:uncharacterized protein [Antedon mediterranea]|uniref:uncharacterized protein n=1 Tax=Antedon mediterranea TaxID=105859 RepID=UPI003AF91950